MEVNIQAELDALRLALQNEMDSYEFYVDIQEKYSNPITKNIFKFLAEQEHLHIAKIEEFDKELSINLKDLRTEFQFNTDEVEERAKNLFDLNVGVFNKKVDDEDVLQPYKIALDVELAGYRYYKNAAEKATDFNLKKFFTFLMREEQIHHSLIKNTLAYLQDPENYYAEAEDWLFEG